MNVGAFSLSPAVMVAPMAGVTDLPFHETVHDFGRVWVEGEMVSANPDLLESNESERKIAFGDEPSPRIVQLLGAVPAWMNRAASFVEECGARKEDLQDRLRFGPDEKPAPCGRDYPGSLRNGFRPCDPQDADRLGQ